MEKINERFSELYRINAEKIYSLAYKMCGNHQDAQDVMQSTFTLAYEKYDGFRGESSEFTWLYAIAKNLCLKLLKERKKSSFKDINDLISYASGPANFKESVSEAEMRDLAEQVKEGCLLGLVRCLSFYQRTAFILHILMELSVPSTAKILGKSESATRTLVFRAKKKIKEFLCNNCSLYDSANPCRCENLIGFSLKQNWIQRRETSLALKDSGVKGRSIEEEIKGAEKMILLYRSLPSISCDVEMKKSMVDANNLNILIKK